MLYRWLGAVLSPYTQSSRAPQRDGWPGHGLCSLLGSLGSAGHVIEPCITCSKYGLFKIWKESNNKFDVIKEAFETCIK